MRKDTVKTKLSPLKGKRKLDYVPSKTKSSVKLPLLGKTVYLDVKEAKHRKRLQHDLKRLGGTIEEFLSKDINYLITTQSRPRQRKDVGCDGETPVPSPFNCDPSPSPGNTEERRVTSVTRGKALAEKARVQAKETNSLVDNAEKWGVRIVSLEGAYKWIDKELKKLPKQALSKKSHKSDCVAKYKNFKAPFLKIEVSNFCYRPLHQELEVWPRLNVDTPRGSCPFDGTLIKGGDHSNEERGELLAAQVDIQSEETPKEEKDGLSCDSNNSKISQGKAAKKSEQDSTNRVLTAGEIRRQKDLKRKLDRKRGYCECCQVKYEDLDKHVREEAHRAYIKDKCHYEKLDEVINSGPNTVTFISQCLSKAVSIRNPKSLLARDDEVNLSGDNHLKSVHDSPYKQYDQTRSKRTPTKNKDKKDSEKKSKISDQTKYNTPKINKKEIDASKQEHVTSSTKQQNEKSQEQKQRKTYSKEHKRTPTKIRDKEVKDQKEINSKKIDYVLKETQNSPIKSRLETYACESKASPRRSEKISIENKQYKKHNTNSPRFSPRLHKVDKENEINKSSKSCDTQSEKSVMSPRSSKCLSALFDKEMRKTKQSEKPSNQDENKSESSEANISEMADINFEIMSKNSSRSQDKSKKKKDGKNKHEKINHENMVSEMEDANNAEGSTTEKNSPSKTEIRTKLVSYSNDVHKPKTESGNNLESCLINVLNKKVKEKKDRSEKNLINKNASHLIVSTADNEDKESKKKKKVPKPIDRCSQSSKENSSKHSKISRKIILEEDSRRSHKLNKTNSKKSTAVNENLPAVQSVKTTVVDDFSDIPSDRQQGFDGDILIFTKTLAERIKERSRSRPASETSLYQSYNVECDIGFSNKKSRQKTVSHVSSKINKSRANIASQKVLNKYRFNRVSNRKTDNTQAGYEGDDEMRTRNKSRTKKTSTRSKTSSKDKEAKQKAERQKFWFYEVISDGEATTDGSVISRPTRNTSKSQGIDQEISDVESIGITEKKNENDKFVQPKVRTNKTKCSDRKSITSNLSKKKSNKENDREWSAQNEYEFESSDVSNTETEIAKKKTKHKKFRNYESVQCKGNTQIETNSMATDGENSDRILNQSKQKKKDAQQDSDRPTANIEQSKSFKKPRTKKFWFYTTEVEDNNKTKSMVDDVEILPTKLRNVNGRRESQTIESGQDIESDTNNLTENESENKLKSSKKDKTKKFWFYTTEPINNEDSLNEEVEILPSKLRRLNGQRNSLNIDSEKNNESDTYTHSDSEPHKKTISSKRSKNRNEKDLNVEESFSSKLQKNNCQRDSQNVESEQDNESDATKESDTKTAKKSKSKKFWFYTTVPVNNYKDSNEVEILPSKLRAFNGRTCSMNMKSWPKLDSDTNNLSDSGSTTRTIESKQKVKSKKFWYYITEPVKDDNDMNDVEILPSKLRKSIGRSDSKGNESGHDIESDAIKQSDSELKQNTKETKNKPRSEKFWFYTTEVVHNDKNKSIVDDVEILPTKLRKVNERRESQNIESESDTNIVEILPSKFKKLKGKSSSLNVDSDKNNQSDIDKQLDSEHYKKIKSLKKSKSKNFWFYTTDVEDNDKSRSIVDDVEILPTKLRKVNKRRESQTIESGQDIESDTNNLTENESKRKLKTSKKDNTKKFWFYTTEPMDNEDSLNEEVEILPSKLRRLNGQRNSLIINSEKNNESDTLHTDKHSDSEHYEKTKSSKKSKSKRFYTSETVNNKQNTDNEVDVLPGKFRHVKGQKECSVSDTEMKKKKSKCIPTSQTHHAVTYLTNVQSSESETKSREDKNKSSSKEHKEVSSHCVKEPKILKVCEDSDNVHKIIAYKDDRVISRNENTKAEKIENKREKGRSESAKFWTYESFVEPESNESKSDLPKELQILESAWNDLSDVSSIHKPRRSRGCSANINYNVNIIGGRVESNFKTHQTQQNIENSYKKSRVQNSTDSNHICPQSQMESNKTVKEVENTYEISKKCNNKINTDTISAKVTNHEHTKVWDSYACVEKTNEQHKSREEKSEISKEERRRRKREKREKKLEALRNTDTNKKVNEKVKVSQRSCSPTFNRTSSSSQERHQRRQEKRPGSPVFTASPSSKRQKTCDQNSQPYVNSGSNNADNIANRQESKGLKQCKLGELDLQGRSNSPSIDCISPIKKTNKASVSQKGGKTTPSKTPDKKILISTPASGFSTTSREVRRKQWKRKIMDMNSSGLSNDDSSPFREKKKKKLEKLKYKIDGEEVNTSLTSVACVISDKVNSDLEKSDKRPDFVKDNKCVPKSPLIKPLSWNPSSSHKRTGQTVKLDKSWNLLSERSVSKLLSSEGDQPNFEGFSQEEVDKSLRSDLSYEECSEVSLESDSEHEWVVDEANEAVPEAKEEEFVKFVPLTYSSPGKRSDSSWLDACEDYIDRSLKKDNKDSSLYLSFVTSPWKSPIKRSKAAYNSSNSSTPVKQNTSVSSPRKNQDTSLKRVDRDIEFNFGSPQKLRGEFSPLRCKNGKVIDTSSPVSNNFVKSSKSGHCKKLLDDYSGLVFSGDDDNSESERKHTQFKLLKKVSSNKKVYNIVYEKSPKKVKKKKKICN